MRVGGDQPGGSDGGIPVTLRVALVLFVFGVTALVVASLVILLRPVAAPSPTHDLSRPIRTAVVLVPIGDFPGERTTAIRDRVAADYHVPITVAAPIPQDPSMIDPRTGQLVAESVVSRLGNWHPEWQDRILVIGLTAADLAIAGRPDWRFAFSFRDSDGLAVVSSARLRVAVDNGDDARWRRFDKMVVRAVAFLYFGLRPVTDPTDMLYDSILRAGDIDRIADYL